VLNLQQIIETVMAIGIDDLTMSKLAHALGVSKAVLYNYVSSREELVQLAAGHALLLHPFPKDEGQPWQEFVIEYARALMDFFVHHAQLISTYVQGDFGPLIQTEGAEDWLSVLTRQGFGGHETLTLQQSVESVVLGSALNWLHAQALAKSGKSYVAQAHDAVTRRGPGGLPLLAKHIDAFAAKGDYARWEHTVRLLIAGAAAGKQGSAS
jgi:AcrR family transcriptional regulator